MRRYIGWILKYVVSFFIIFVVNFLIDRLWNEFGITPIMELLQTSLTLITVFMIYDIAKIVFNKIKKKKKNNM